MLTDYETRQLETLFRQAVLLNVNPSGGPAPCELGCGRIGSATHHVVFRSQEPAIRLKYEPRFAALVCGGCHEVADSDPETFIRQLLGILHNRNPRKAACLEAYLARHDLIRAPKVSYGWMKKYLQRCIERAGRRWADAYCDSV